MRLYTSQFWCIPSLYDPHPPIPSAPPRTVAAAAPVRSVSTLSGTTERTAAEREIYRLMSLIQSFPPLPLDQLSKSSVPVSQYPVQSSRVNGQVLPTFPGASGDAWARVAENEEHLAVLRLQWSEFVSVGSPTDERAQVTKIVAGARGGREVTGIALQEFATVSPDVNYTPVKLAALGVDRCVHGFINIHIFTCHTHT